MGTLVTGQWAGTAFYHSIAMMVGPSRALINYTILLNLEGLSQKILNQEGLLKKT